MFWTQKNLLKLYDELTADFWVNNRQSLGKNYSHTLYELGEQIKSIHKNPPENVSYIKDDIKSLMLKTTQSPVPLSSAMLYKLISWEKNHPVMSRLVEILGVGFQLLRKWKLKCAGQKDQKKEKSVSPNRGED